jgi:S-adenosylhomocysteine hydrolase/8-oxo-dGTP pyrophosphatase MutT (NUDIX family)
LGNRIIAKVNTDTQIENLGKTCYTVSEKRMSMGSKDFAKQDDAIRSLFEKYIDYSGRSSDGKRPLKLASKQIKNGVDLTNRKNFEGHFTASIFLLCKKTRRVLLLEHKARKMMLQPGGHIDAREAPLQAALRELAEETGIKDGFKLRSLAPGDRGVPLNISTHAILENPKKGEAEHFHHDFEYLAITEGENDVVVRKSEVSGFKWVDWDDFATQEKFKAVAIKIEELAFSDSAGAYYESLLDQKAIDDIRKNNYACLAIQHIVLNSVPSLLFLKAVFGNNLQVLAKPKSINTEVMELLKKEGVDIVVANRLDNFEKYISGKTILMDIGGYFTRIAKKKGLPIIGIIEDTESGLRKYEAIKKQVKYPVVSVARSELKDNDGKLVNETILHAVDTVLRQRDVIIDYCRCGVIGYGRAGAGITRSLLKKGIKPYVAELNPIRLAKAANDYCYVVGIDYLVSNSTVIFCAIGDTKLSIDVLRKVKNGAFVTSVMSSDSEFGMFDIQAIESEYSTEKISEHITKYISEHNYFYLLNGGNAMSFSFSSALGVFVHLELGEELSIVNSLVASKKYRVGVQLSRENANAIAASWVQEFLKFDELKSPEI